MLPHGAFGQTIVPVGACQEAAVAGNYWIPARGGKGMVPTGAKLWFKAHVSLHP